MRKPRVTVQAELLYAVVMPVSWRSRLGVTHVRVTRLCRSRADAMSEAVARVLLPWRALKAAGYRCEKYSVVGDGGGAVTAPRKLTLEDHARAVRLGYAGWHVTYAAPPGSGPGDESCRTCGHRDTSSR